MKNSTFKTVVKTKTTTQKVTTRAAATATTPGEHQQVVLSGYSGMIGVKTGSARGSTASSSRHPQRQTVIGTVLASTSITP